MERNLSKKLIKTALISSPIIALYGVSPVYIFNKIPTPLIYFAGSGLMLNVLAFWIANIWIIKKTWTNESKRNRYLFSYLCTLAIHFGFSGLRWVTFNSLAFTKLDPRFMPEEMAISRGELFIYPLVSVFAINTIILIISNSILLAHKKENADLEIEYLKVNNLEAQKQMLIQQLQPHFLFNTLSALKSLIKESPEDAENYTIKLSEFLRYTVQVNNTHLVALSEELKFTTDYIDLQKVRFEKSLLVDIHVPYSLNGKKIPAYALQTLVENAIKHNAFTEAKPLYIHIYATEKTITVMNNKFMTKANEKSGLGLKNLNSRYNMISNQDIIISDDTDSFSVTVYLFNESSV